MCNLEKKPWEDTADQTDNENSSLTFMMMEIASDGFPGRSWRRKQKSKARQANDAQNTTDLNIPTQPEGAGKCLKFQFHNNELSDEQRLSENCIYGG